MVIVCLGLGSNLGNREELLEQGVQALQDRDGIEGVRFSALYETEPVGPVEQGMFLNMALVCETTLSPREVLKTCKDIEINVGGKKTDVRWGPRQLDIDILLYGDEQLNEPPSLIIPHPEMLTRNFVLIPLAEIAPDIEIPGFGLTVSSALKACGDTSGVKRIS